MGAFIGEIRLSGFNFLPHNWLSCNGQILAINKYVALYTLLGVRFGGDGRNTFRLPDLRGRAPVHSGHGSELTNRIYGEIYGEETVILDISQMPVHDHAVNINSLDLSASFVPHCQIGFSGDQTTPAHNYLATSPATTKIYSKIPNSTMGKTDVKVNLDKPIHEITTEAGGNIEHKNMQPSLALNYMICYNGIYPQHP